MERGDARLDAVESSCCVVDGDGMASRSSRLELLPPELRNSIYEMALTVPSAIKLSRRPHQASVWMKWPGRQTHILALTMVSKAIRNETLVLFFNINEFAFTSNRGNGDFYLGSLLAQSWFKDDLALLGTWLHGLKTSGIKRLGNIAVHTSTWAGVIKAQDVEVQRSWEQLHNTMRSVVMNRGVPITELTVKYEILAVDAVRGRSGFGSDVVEEVVRL